MLRTECVEHKGCALPNGYGKVGRGGKTWLAHRLAWHENVGPIPFGAHVCHKCDNRLCVNVDHLFLGTRSDNMQDMINKGRARFVGFTHKNYRPPAPRAGELNGRSKLSRCQVEEIKRLRQLGLKQEEVGAMFGVSQTTVWRIESGNGWKS